MAKTIKSKHKFPSAKGYFCDTVENICVSLGVPNIYPEYTLIKITESNAKSGGKRIHSYKNMHFIHKETGDMHRIDMHRFAVFSCLGLPIDFKLKLVVHHCERTRDNNHIDALVLTTWTDNLRMDDPNGDEIEQYYINKMQLLIDDVCNKGIEPETALNNHYLNKAEDDKSPGEIKNIATSRIDLKVPFVEKDKARSSGAQWDREKKTWFIPEGRNISKLVRWIPPEPEDIGSILEKLNFEVSD